MNGFVPVISHSREAEAVPQADLSPYALFRGNEIGKAFADEREPSKVANVGGCHVLHDVDEEFAGKLGDGTGWWRRALNRGGGRLDLQAGKGSDEILDGEQDGILSRR